MINVNLRVPTGSATENSQLLEQLAKKADGNHDGTVTSAEFTAFLSTLMKSLDDEQPSTTAAGGDNTSSAASSSALPQELTGLRPASPSLAIEALRRAIAKIGRE